MEQLPNGGDRRALVALSAWGVLLFAICFGLGYPTLNRYDLRSIPGLSDGLQYYEIVEQGPQAAKGHFKYRIFVPYLAKPIYWAVRGRLGSWDPVSFALLIINSLFCAGAALMVSILAYGLRRNYLVAVTAAFAYLLNFTVANFHLSGMIDAADAFWFLLLTWGLTHRKWMLLPAIGLLAGLTKETFVPIGFVFAATWLLSESSTERTKGLMGAIAMALVGLVTALLVRSLIDQTLVTPWQVVAQERSPSPDAIHNLIGIGASWSLWLTIIWAPFLCYVARRFPKCWLYAALAAVVATLVLSAWNSAGGSNTARPLFNLLGPLFAISFALAVEGFQKGTFADTETLPN